MPRDIHDHLPEKKTETVSRVKEPGAMLMGVGADASASNAVMTIDIENVVSNKSLHPHMTELEKSRTPVLYTERDNALSVTAIQLKDNARYDHIAEIRLSDLNKYNGYTVDLLPTHTTQKVNVIATTHFGVDETTITDPEKLKQTAKLVTQALQSGQPGVTVSIEGRASATGNPNAKIKTAHNFNLSSQRAEADKRALKDLVIGQGVSPAEFEQKAKITQQALGDTDPLEKTLNESDLNRVAITRINNVEIKKGNYHEIILTPENADDIRNGAWMQGGGFVVNWPKKGPDDTQVAGNPIKEESIAATIRLENAFLMKTAPIVLSGIENLDNVKIAVDTKSLPGDANLIMDYKTASGTNVLYLGENGNLRKLAEFPVVDEQGARRQLGVIKNVVWRDPQGHEYNNINGMPLNKIIDIHNIKHGALDAFKKADIDHDGVLIGTQLKDFTLNGSQELMKILDRAEGLKITYDVNHQINEIDLVSSKENLVPVKQLTQSPAKIR